MILNKKLYIILMCTVVNICTYKNSNLYSMDYKGSYENIKNTSNEYILLQCESLLKANEKSLLNNLDEIRNKVLEDYNYNERSKFNKFKIDLSYVFHEINKELSNYTSSPVCETNKIWRQSNYIPIQLLAKYKQLLDKFNINIKNNNIEKYIVNNIKDNKIPIYTFCSYINNKILNIGNNVLGNINQYNQNKICNILQMLEYILSNIKNDIKKSINTQHSYNTNLLLFNNSLNICNWSINNFYKIYYPKLVLQKVNKLHDGVISYLENLIQQINDGKIENMSVVCNSSNMKLDYAILSAYTKLNNKLTDIFKDGKKMQLKDYLINLKSQLVINKKLYDNKISVLYIKKQYINTKIDEKENINIEVLRYNNDPSDEHLNYEFNSYTKNYINIAKYLIENIIKNNKIQNPYLIKLLKIIENREKNIINGNII